LYYYPLAFETGGNWHPLLKEFVNALAAEIATVTGRPLSVVLSYWTKRISVSIHRGVSRQILKSNILHNTTRGTHNILPIPNGSYLSSSQPSHHDIYEAQDTATMLRDVARYHVSSEDCSNSMTLFDEFLLD